jgi:cobalt ECF transporter T component CbiQ
MNSLPPFLTETATGPAYQPSEEKVRTPVLEKGVHHLAGVIRESYEQWECSRRDGLLQRVDPRVKLVLMAAFLILVSFKREIQSQAGIALFLFILCLLSRLDMIPLYRRIFSATLLFGVLVPLPSLLNLFDNSHPAVPLLHLGRDYRFWMYRIPETIGITSHGLTDMALLAVRIANSVAISLLVLHTTSFPDLIKALRVFRVPESFIGVVTLAYKYIFTFTRTLEEMHLAKKSRLLGRMDAGQSRQWAAGRIAFIFQKCQGRCEEIFKAMLARGYENRATFHEFPKMKRRDWGALAIGLASWSFFLLW